LPSLKDFGLQFEPQNGMNSRELLDWCKYAEEKGYGYAFRSDHLLPIPVRVADSPECWTSLGAIAASTKSIRFGTMVTPISYRNPALLAKMARTVNDISGGRLIFGLGAGWYETEYAAYGYEFPGIANRIERFEEALKIIIPMTKGEKVAFAGKHFRADVEALATRETYFLIGGRHSRIVRDAAMFADEWNIYACDRDKLIRFKKMFDAAASGRRVVASQTGVVLIAENHRALVEQVKEKLREAGIGGDPQAEIEGLRQGGTICGTPAEVASQINEIRDLGFERVYLEVADMRTKNMADLLTETLKGL
jgi:alkanesulfonate monooxygenase SsuD/methylene tetrahydromethanopterin reductase-like flavin-dependent oxidoreductase (luciferase family)